MAFTRIKNNPSRQVVRLPRAGKIRLGIKLKSARTGNEYPKETEFFVCPPEVERIFGKDPKQLRVMLPTENEEMVLRQYYASYGKNHRLKCQGDGEQAERRTYKTVGGNEVEAGIEKMACPSPDACDFAKEHSCVARTDLMVILPEVSMGAAYQVSSGSTLSDIDIRSGIEMAKAMVGRISWVPMILAREEALIPDPKTGKMCKHWPVKLVPAFDFSALQALRADNQRIENWSKQYALPEPVVEGEEADTPIEFVDSMPGEEDDATPDPGPSSSADPVNEIDPVASAQIRTDMANDLRNSGSVAAIEAIGAAIARISHRLMKADLDSLRMEYDRLLTEAKRAKRRVAP